MKSMITPDRQSKRLLRLVGRAGGATFKREGEDKVSILRDGKAYAFQPACLTDACQRGLLAISGERLTLTADGRAALKRALHPEDPLRAQHMEPETPKHPPGSAAGIVTVNAGESPLARLRRVRGRDGRPWLGDAEFAAGERFRADFERAGLMPSVTSRWDASGRTGGGGAGDAAAIPDFAIDARRRFNAAVASLETSLRDAAIDVCCFLKGLEQVERERHWPPRSAKLMLRTALAMLARHYGLSTQAPDRPSTVLHWGVEAYRPALRSSE